MKKIIEIENDTVQQVQQVQQLPIEMSYISTISNLIYFLFGLLETGLIFRLMLKLTGASQTSGFVSFIYGFTEVFTRPFEGIFRRSMIDGLQAEPVFEPSTFIAIIVYAVVAFGIVKLVQILSGEKQEITLES